MWQHIIELDHWLLIKINNWGDTPYDAFWLFITQAIHWIPFFLLILYITLSSFPKKEALRIIGFTLITLLTTILITHTTKEIVMRLRPIHSNDIAPYLRIITTEEGYSFFSGHTSNSFAICTFLYLLFRRRIRWAFWVFLWAIPYSYSRLYLGVHFPSDVLIGLIVGIIIAYTYFYIYQKHYNH